MKRFLLLLPIIFSISFSYGQKELTKKFKDLRKNIEIINDEFTGEKLYLPKKDGLGRLNTAISLTGEYSSISGMMHPFLIFYKNGDVSFYALRVMMFSDIEPQKPELFRIKVGPQIFDLPVDDISRYVEDKKEQTTFNSPGALNMNPSNTGNAELDRLYITRIDIPIDVDLAKGICYNTDVLIRAENSRISDYNFSEQAGLVKTMQTISKDILEFVMIANKLNIGL